MTLALFAARYRLKLKSNSGDGTPIIPGRLGHIYEYGDRRLGVLIMPDPPRKNYWAFQRRKFVAVGMEVRQNGDCEGAVLFEPENAEHAAVAIRAVQAKRKRAVSDKQRQRLVEQGRKTRIVTALGGHLGL